MTAATSRATVGTTSGSGAVFVHPRGLCESDHVGAGTRIWAFAHVMPGARIGRDCNVCDHAFVESGAVVGDRVTIKNAVLIWDLVTVEDDAFLGPNMIFTNDMNPRAEVKKGPDRLDRTLVRRGATIGANATIVCGTTLGEYCFVAAGAVVIRDVAAHALVVGNPARQVGWVCACGERLDDELSCTCGRTYEHRPADIETAALAGLCPTQE
ncbi:acyltransferase [Protofrankia symbiont of Coriaria ruscifolia]|uniref:acyltransferase n=1 Tax=Protofrankia symbiont of Coriaria ruscifolia TaxID=1306542 RepID=UPI0010417978|nr:acyltransferase [Protofrankia symbiont of Coriaria ruscifolia]